MKNQVLPFFLEGESILPTAWAEQAAACFISSLAGNDSTAAPADSVSGLFVSAGKGSVSSAVAASVCPRTGRGDTPLNSSIGALWMTRKWVLSEGFTSIVLGSLALIKELACKEKKKKDCYTEKLLKKCNSFTCTTQDQILKVSKPQITEFDASK